MTTLLTVGRGGAVADAMSVFSSPAVKVHSSAMVGCVDGDSTMSDKGYAVGLEEMRVKGTVGGGVSAAVGAEVTVSGLESFSWRRMLAPSASRGNGAANSARLKSILEKQL